ncbi:hypothetical protein MtrunA17_Chr2g0312701 [Medicago truncatula]|uniref:Uncharacterized protein n=1 Tax=Medicago truncatula TaxID=3880 RepID=A0A396JC56_MEDTR|nr:hypothetical protein MtrunA17_Chr2g0312701 [Medicago truncatula]
MYFCYETTIPFFDRATSIPRKYLMDPKSLISKSTANFSFTLAISTVSSPVRTISST